MTIPRAIEAPVRVLWLMAALWVCSCGDPPAEHRSAGANESGSAQSVRHPQKSGADSARPAGQKILYIVVDALRADRLGCYGGPKDISPSIDGIAAEGVLFESVHAASPWTAPSFGTLFTGVSPTVHGAGGMLARGSREGADIHGVTVGGIRTHLATMAELLSGTMRTAAVVNNAFVTKELGFARGFDHFDFRIARLTRYRTADATTDAAVAWLKDNGDNPFFLLVHYFDPHIQYGPPAKYVAMFAKDRPPRIAVPFVDHGAARDGSLDPDEREKAFIRGLYNGEVRFADDEIGRLLAVMKQSGRLEDTWIVVLSDHGEEHFEHGSFEHGHRYEEEVVRVPFILRAPGGRWHAGRRIPTNVSHIDVLPTMLEIAGVASPAHLEGHSVLAMLDNPRPSNRPSYMEFNLFNGQQCAFYDGRYKIIHDLRRNSAFMYDLREDPEEQHRLDGNHPAFSAVEKQLQSRRARLMSVASGRPDNDAAMSGEAGEALRSLGYIE